MLPDPSTWRINHESKSAARGSCSRFDELSFTVVAEDLGHQGQLELTFINNQPLLTSFRPDDFAGYVKALKTRLSFRADGRARVPPSDRRVADVGAKRVADRGLARSAFSMSERMTAQLLGPRAPRVRRARSRGAPDPSCFDTESSQRPVLYARLSEGGAGFR
jgi:hypothetical protein